MTLAETIYQQIGGNRFVAMTGANTFIDINNGLRFKIGRNASKANMIDITLNGKDLYDIKFIKYTPYKFNVNTMTEREEKVEIIKTYADVYNDMLQDVFSQVTGMYTRL